jgi:hypothetical protein
MIRQIEKIHLIASRTCDFPAYSIVVTACPRLVLVMYWKHLNYRVLHPVARNINCK